MVDTTIKSSQSGNQQKYTLIICEKPNVAKRLSNAIGSKNIEKVSAGNNTIYKVSNGITNYVIISSKGHLYALYDKNKDRKVFPVFDLNWHPISDDSKNLKLIETIRRYSDAAENFIHACDYDQEGELIGYNILQFACKNRYYDSLRAKFSTLTNEDIVKSFSNLETPDQNLAYAAMFRHILDFIYGINFSRSLMSSIKFKGMRSNLTFGRVQSPTLRFIVDRQDEINFHVSTPFWIIKGNFEKDNHDLDLLYQNGNCSSILEAEKILKECEKHDGIVSKINKSNEYVVPPYPFNLGELQKESFRLFKFSPSYTLRLAERLYLRALISYPRTDSQIYPFTLNLKRILKDLSKISIEYQSNVSILFQLKKLCPRNGRQDDPAHPAIYPTGKKPAALTSQEYKIFDLIVKRFFATFGDPLIFSKTTILVKVNRHIFYTNDRKISYLGWVDLYNPYYFISRQRQDFPDLKVGDKLKNIKIFKEEKFTEPPKNFNYSSLLSKMEKEEIGTKSTRGSIIDVLVKRGYVHLNNNNTILPTQLGISLIKYLLKKSPNIVSTNLTKIMESYLRDIESGTRDKADILDEIMIHFLESIYNFKINDTDLEIENFNISFYPTSKYHNNKVILGSCPMCKKGNLQIIRSKKTRKRFISCSDYFTTGCSITLPLPQRGSIKFYSKTCSCCNWPIINIFYNSTRSKKSLCVNINCENKKKLNPNII
ncbi:MAG: DNA topoisomerase I [Nitrososphaeraceae archaeon]